MRSALYKLYVVWAERPAETTRETPPDPIPDFLAEFWQELKKALAAPTGPPAVTNRRLPCNPPSPKPTMDCRQ